jgi:hypothetical protein
MPVDDPHDELFRAFAAATSGAELIDLWALTDNLPAHAAPADLDEVLRGPFFALRDSDIDRRLIELAGQVRHHKLGDDLIARLTTVATLPTTIDAGALPGALRAPLWFIARAADGGLPLTSDGYLQAADVEAASDVVPMMSGWFGPRDRESLCRPVLNLRRTLQMSGLLRKHKGALVATRAGSAGLDDPRKLWRHLASRLIPTIDGRSFSTEATLLLLAYAGGAPGAGLPRTKISRTLRILRWRPASGGGFDGHEAVRLPAYVMLANIGGPGPARHDYWISAEAATLARTALRRG